jgi:hypothetical protein
MLHKVLRLAHGQFPGSLFAPMCMFSGPFSVRCSQVVKAQACFGGLQARTETPGFAGAFVFKG